MSFLKTQLKSARDSIASKNYEYAESTCIDILEQNPDNYNALVFLAVAQQNLEQIEKSIKSYKTAIELSPSNPLAYQGLVSLFESQNDKEQLQSALKSLFDVYIATSDVKCLNVLQKRIQLAEETGDQLTCIECMKEMLPESQMCRSFGSELSLPMTHKETLLKLIELCEKRDSNTIKKEIEARRTRLGADPYVVLKVKVENEVALESELDAFYEQLLSLTEDNDEKNALCSKLLGVLCKKLSLLDNSSKPEMFLKIHQLASELVSNDFPDAVAFEFMFETANVNIMTRDVSIAEKAAALSDEHAIAYFAKAYVQWRGNAAAIDKIIEIANMGLEKNSSSIFGHHLLAKLYVMQSNWSTAVDCIQRCKELVVTFMKENPCSLSQVILDLDLMLGESFLNLDKRSISQAFAIYKSVLESYADNIDALNGLGIASCLTNRFEEALEWFEQAMSRDSLNQTAAVEKAWVYYRMDKVERSLEELKHAETVGVTYLTRYRLAKVYWTLGNDYKSDKQYVHACLIDAARLNPKYAPTFCLLGQYYLHVEKDDVRAEKCFAKAVSVDGSNEKSINELYTFWVSRNMIDKVIPLLHKSVTTLPRSFWLWKQLGILSLWLGKHSDAVTQLQMSLRIESKDPIVWTSLGEAYNAEGKYMAAVKALDRALEIDGGYIHAKYLKGKVNQKLGLWTEAISCFKDCVDSLDATYENESSRKIVPALYALADVHFSYAKKQFEDGAYGSCSDNLLSALCCCSQCLPIIQDLQCTFKILGDVCLALVSLTPELMNEQHEQAIRSIMQTSPVVISSESVLFNGMSLEQAESRLDVALCGTTRFYYTALCLALNTKSVAAPSYAHDLSIAYYYSSKTSTCSLEEKERLLEAAIRTIKLAIRASPDKPTYWSDLGVYYMLQDPALCQHCLIKAAELDSQSPSVWCNLGFFYLIHDDADLAKQSFVRAQLVDPDWCMAWFGQGFIASQYNSPEASNLLEQAFDLSTAHIDVLFKFASVCFEKPDSIPSALNLASFCLLKCVERRPEDASIYNMYGLVLERLGRYDEAVWSFEQGLNISQSEAIEENTKYILENKARVQCSAGKFEEACETYSKLVEIGVSNMFVYVGQGIASFFINQLETSLTAFEHALSLVDEMVQMGQDAKDAKRVKNDIVLMLSQVLFALDTPEHIELAKQQLLGCISEEDEDVYPPAVIALAVMGIVQQDWMLAQSAAVELLKITPEQFGSLDKDSDWVLAWLFFKQNENKTAIRFMSKCVHKYPWKAQRWAYLAECIYSLSPSKSGVASDMALSGLSIFDESKSSGLSSTLVGNMYRICGLALLSESKNAGRLKQSKSFICRAIRLCPSDARNWVALGLSELSNGSVIGNSAISLLKTHGNDGVELGLWAHLIKSYALGVDEAIALVDAVTTSAQTCLLKQAGYMLLSRLLIKLHAEDTSMAVQALRNAHELMQETHWDSASLMLADLLKGDKEEALGVYNSILEWTEENSSKRTVTLLRMVQLDPLNEMALRWISEALRLDVYGPCSRYMQNALMIIQQQGVGQEGNSRWNKNMKVILESKGDIDASLIASMQEATDKKQLFIE